jgi:hypothetical protein
MLGRLSPAGCEASLLLSPVIESLVPFFDAACTAGVCSVVACTRSWGCEAELEKFVEVPIDPIPIKVARH